MDDYETKVQPEQTKQNKPFKEDHCESFIAWSK